MRDLKSKGFHILFSVLVFVCFVMCFTACNQAPETQQGTLTVFVQTPTRSLLKATRAITAPEGTQAIVIKVPNGVIDKDFLTRNGINPEFVVALELDSKIVEIQEDAFKDCTKLEKVNIPKTVKTLSPKAFSEDTFVYSDTKQIAENYNADVHYPVTVTFKNVYVNASGVENSARTTTDTFDTYNGLVIDVETIRGFAQEIDGYNGDGPDYSVDLTDPETNPIYAENNQVITITWTANTYNVHFCSEVKPLTVVKELAVINGIEYDAEAEIPPVIYDVEGWHIDGWTDSDGSIYLNQGEMFENLTAVDNDDVYVFLVPAKNDAEYTIKFDLNGATSDTGVESITATCNEYVDMPNIPEDCIAPVGMHFVGWARDKYASSAEFIGKKKPINLCTGEEGDEEITLYAVWNLNEYEIQVFYGNDRVDSKYVKSSITYGDDLTDWLDGCALYYASKGKEGYSFVGLSENEPDPSATSVSVDFTNNAPILHTNKEHGKKLKLYIVEAPRVYLITFNGNGATSGSMTPQTMTYDTPKALKKNTFVRDHYEFAGWYTDWNMILGRPVKLYGDGEVVGKIAGYVNAELKAYWTPLTYTINFVDIEDHGSITLMEPQTSVYYDERTKLNTYNGSTQYENCYLKGWTDGTNEYLDGSSVLNLFAPEPIAEGAEDTNQITLTAVWGDAYNIVFSSSNVTAAVREAKSSAKIKNAPLDGTVKLPSSYSVFGKENDGYVFRYWTTSNKDDDSASKYYETLLTTDTFTAPTDTNKGDTVTLYAVWDAVVNVSLGKNVGEEDGNKILCKVTDSITVKSIESTGVIVKYWKLTLTANGKDYCFVVAKKSSDGFTINGINYTSTSDLTDATIKISEPTTLTITSFKAE